MVSAEAHCPKRMRYGPCGGVRHDLSCEMLPLLPCPFATGDVVGWEGRPAPQAPPGGVLGTAATRPVVLTDLTVRPFDARSVRAVSAVLVGSCDAVLVGEHHGRPDFPPTIMAPMLHDAGVAPWITLSCRDRNRIVLQQEVVGLAEIGVAGVLCVTGDGRGPGVRPDATQVFDIDGTRLAEMAADAGLTVAIAESPDAPPVALRPARIREKQRAGAHVAVLNHVGSVERVAAFVAAARAAGATLPMIAAVAVYTDERSAAVLQRFPGLHLDADEVQRVLSAPDPVTAGTDAAVAQARRLLAVDGVVGVNLSGLAAAGDEVVAAGIKATVGREILAAFA